MTSTTSTGPSIDHVLSTYLQEDAPVFFLTFNHDGTIQKSNTYTREVTGMDPGGKRIDEVFFSLEPGYSLQELVKRKEQMLNVQTFTGLPQTYYVRFFSGGDTVLAVGRLDMKEIESLRKKLIDLTNNLNNLNRQLHKANAELNQARDQLEDRVKQRTSELSETNARLIAENKERKRAQRALNKSEKELLRLSARLLEAHEEERKRIAADLHDGLAQTLSAVQVWLGAAASDVGRDNDAAGQSLESARKLAQEAIDEVQIISRNLRPSMLDNLGLNATIDWLCNGFKKIHPQIRVDKRLDVPEKQIPEPLKIVIFRILQEALNNIAKHSKANYVGISLTQLNGRRKQRSLKLSIHDNGQGFDRQKVNSHKSSPRGLGMDTMKERAELSGGSFSLSSQPGLGTSIQTAWPV